MVYSTIGSLSQAISARSHLSECVQICGRFCRWSSPQRQTAFNRLRQAGRNSLNEKTQFFRRVLFFVFPKNMVFFLMRKRAEVVEEKQISSISQVQQEYVNSGTSKTLIVCLHTFQEYLLFLELLLRYFSKQNQKMTPEYFAAHSLVHYAHNHAWGLHL